MYKKRRDRRPVVLVCVIVVVVSMFLQFLVIRAQHKGDSTPHLSKNTPKVTVGTSTKPYGIALGGTLDKLNKNQLDSELQNLESIGVRWIRIDIAWPAVQPSSSAQYNWSSTDRIVSAASSYHLQVLGTLAYTPDWAAAKNCNNSGQKCAPASNNDFANFATSAAKRYKDNGVAAWEVWNEPNNQGFWMPAPDPTAYTALLKTTYSAIKSVNPAVPILAGSLGSSDGQPTSINPVTFLSGMYASGAHGYFDILGFHPYSYPDLPLTEDTWNTWSMMDTLSPSIRSVMVANGDTDTKIWITEYGAPTNGSGPTETSTDYGLVGSNSHVNDQLQAAMLAQSTQQYAAIDWLSNYFWYSYKDLGTSPSDTGDYFGLLNYNGSQKPAYTAYEQAIRNPH